MPLVLIGSLNSTIYCEFVELPPKDKGQANDTSSFADWSNEENQYDKET
jgi:hypothetical protein